MKKLVYKLINVYWKQKQNWFVWVNSKNLKCAVWVTTNGFRTVIWRSKTKWMKVGKGLRFIMTSSLEETESNIQLEAHFTRISGVNPCLHGNNRYANECLLFTTLNDLHICTWIFRTKWFVPPFTILWIYWFILESISEPQLLLTMNSLIMSETVRIHQVHSFTTKQLSR